MLPVAGATWGHLHSFDAEPYARLCCLGRRGGLIIIDRDRKGRRTIPFSGEDDFGGQGWFRVDLVSIDVLRGTSPCERDPEASASSPWRWLVGVTKVRGLIGSFLFFSELNRSEFGLETRRETVSAAANTHTHTPT